MSDPIEPTDPTEVDKPRECLKKELAIAEKELIRAEIMQEDCTAKAAQIGQQKRAIEAKITEYKEALGGC